MKFYFTLMFGPPFGEATFNFFANNYDNYAQYILIRPHCPQVPEGMVTLGSQTATDPKTNWDSGVAYSKNQSYSNAPIYSNQESYLHA